MDDTRSGSRTFSMFVTILSETLVPQESCLSFFLPNPLYYTVPVGTSVYVLQYPLVPPHQSSHLQLFKTGSDSLLLYMCMFFCLFFLRKRFSLWVRKNCLLGPFPQECHTSLRLPFFRWSLSIED